jgi:hypothetical protein
VKTEEIRPTIRGVTNYTPATTATSTVRVPDGAAAGDELKFEFNGQEVTAIVPEGLIAGDEFLCCVEGAASSSAVTGTAAAMDGDCNDGTIEVRVPEGVRAGDVFYCEVDGFDHTFEVALPEGVEPGATIHLQIVPGETDGGGAAVASATTGASTAAGGAARGSAGRPAVPTHPIGARVRVARTNGSWSDASVVGYDELSETYTVQVGGGALKYMVEESELAPPSYAPRTVGEHFEGRRVQVLLSATTEGGGVGGRPQRTSATSQHGGGGARGSGWEEAFVRAFDEETRTYTVEPLRGGGEATGGDLRTGVRPDQIRLRQRV